MREFSTRHIAPEIFEVFLDGIFVGLIKRINNSWAFYPKKQGTLSYSYDSDTLRAIANFIDVKKGTM